MKDTDLVLESMDKGNVITPFSSRECTQTLTPIPQGVLRRTVNGELVCVSGGGHHKFHSLIQCKDKAPPALSRIWRGEILKVSCIQALTQTVIVESVYAQLDRDSLDLHLIDSSGKEWPVSPPKERWVSIPSGFPGGFITFKPQLIMMVKNYEIETDEWGLSVGWRLELEEV